MCKLGHFITYNNLVPITISVVLLGSSATYAYNNPETIYERSERVVAIDNSYIAGIDFDTFSPSVEIRSVEEDDDAYYVSYRFTTIALVDSVWQNVTSDEEMVVSKDSLGAYRDLGLYVTKELRELVLSEEKRLRETQVFEKRNVTRKQLAIEYSGIIGGRLSPEVQTIEGYNPQISPAANNPERQNLAGPDARSTVSKPVAFSTPPAVQPSQESMPATPQPAAAETDQATGGALGGGGGTVGGVSATTSTTNTSTSTATSTANPNTTASTTVTGDASNSGGSGGGTTSNQPAATTTAPSLTLLGPATRDIVIGQSYTELGIVISDTSDTEPTTNITVNGTQVTSVSIDTSATGEYEITYTVTNESGRTSTITRLVRVVSPDPVVTPPVDTNASTSPDTEPVDIADDTAPILDESEPEPEIVVEPQNSTTEQPTPETNTAATSS